MKTNHLLVVLGTLFAATAAFGCSGDSELEGNGKTVTEVRTAEQFVRIENRGTFDVVVTTGPAFGVTVNVDENLVQKIVTRVVDGTLLLESTEPIDPEIEGPSVTVTLPSLEQVVVTGTGDVDITQFAHPNPIRLVVSGTGDIDFHGSTPQLFVDNTGDGDVELFGTADRIDLVAGSTGDIDGESLIAKTGAVTLTGSGDLSATVQETVDVTSRGSGDIEVFGSPTVGVMVKEGSGQVNVR